MEKQGKKKRGDASWQAVIARRSMGKVTEVMAVGIERPGEVDGGALPEEAAVGCDGGLGKRWWLKNVGEVAMRGSREELAANGVGTGEVGDNAWRGRSVATGDRRGSWVMAEEAFSPEGKRMGGKATRWKLGCLMVGWVLMGTTGIAIMVARRRFGRRTDGIDSQKVSLVKQRRGRKKKQEGWVLGFVETGESQAFGEEKRGEGG